MFALAVLLFVLACLSFLVRDYIASIQALHVKSDLSTEGFNFYIFIQFPILNKIFLCFFQSLDIFNVAGTALYHWSKHFTS